MADKQTVKVGDKVRSKYSCHSGGYDIGDVFTVTKVDGEFIEFVDKDGSDRLRSADEFDLLPVADATGNPAFKVGDRVKVGGDHPYILSDSNTTGKVIGGNNGRRGEWEVQLDNYGGSLSFKTDELERLSSPLTIETGKFYRTRDGRKVGPIDHNGFGVYGAPEYPGHWYENGLSYSDNTHSPTDLIAEWVDEPASIDNAPLTKPAIVALIEEGQPKPSEKPKVHKSEESATDEAERLAVKYPGQKFGVFVLANSRIADVVIRRAA